MAPRNPMEIQQSPAMRFLGGLCFLSALCEGFDVQAAGVAATGIARELHCTPADLGLLFSASGFGLLIGSVVGGTIADRLGRKPVLVASIGMFGAFSLLTAVMPNLLLLVVTRFLTGLGLGGALPNLIALAVETSAPVVRNRSVGIAYIGMPIGGSVASALAFFIPSEAWRELFWVGGMAPLLIVPALMHYFPDTGAVSTTRPRAIRFAGSVQQLLGKGRAARTLLLWLSFFLIVLTLHLMLNWLPFLLTARGLSKDSAMLAQAGFGIGGAVIALKQAALLDSPRPRTSILISIGMLPLLLICAALLPAWPVALFLTSLLLGGAILAQQVIIYAAGSDLYADEARGTGLGTAVAVGRVGSLVGPLLSATLLASGRNAAQVLLDVLPIALASGVCVGLVSWTRRSKSLAPVPTQSDVSSLTDTRSPDNSLT
jgi:MFS transporter, AAHS family, 3-hydroxyphenylpropionic acid transporter